jgi:hypothetical protein
VAGFDQACGLFAECVSHLCHEVARQVQLGGGRQTKVLGENGFCEWGETQTAVVNLAAACRERKNGVDGAGLDEALGDLE